MRRQETRRGGASAPAKAKAPGAAQSLTDTAKKARARPTPESETAKARTAGRGAVGTKARPAPAAAKTAAAKTPAAKKPAAKNPAAAGKSATAGQKAAAPKATAAKSSRARPTPESETAKARTAGRGAVGTKARPAPAAKTTRATAGAPRKATTRTPTAPARAGATVRRATKTAASRDRSRHQEPGVRELDWQHMAGAARDLASRVSHTWSPEIVVGVAKGGVFAGQEVAQALKVPFFPVRVGKRSRDAGMQSPVAAATMPTEADGRRVLVVDDIAGSGATLQAAITDAREAGAAEVRTATLVVREGGYLPDFFCLETGDLVVFPWDYEPSPGAVGSGSGLDDDDETAGAQDLFVGDDEDIEDDIDSFGV